MSEHPCIQEREIGRIVGVLEQIVKDFYGNGQKGFAEEFPVLKKSVDDFGVTIERLRTSVSALNKTIIGTDAVEAYKERENLSARQRASIYVSAIVGISGIIVTVLVKLL